MSRVGILTLYYSNNYGAVLQAYALQNSLKGLGYNVNIINFKPTLSIIAYSTIIPGELGRKYKVLRLPLAKTLRSIAGEALYYLPSITDEFIRNKVFDSFRREVLYIRSKEITNLRDLKHECSRYAAVIVGSDVMWHPSSLKYSDYAYLLPFRLKDTLKMSFSASIGVDVSTIPERVVALYKRCLEGFSFISVRESVHARWLSEVLGREVYHTLDPTLLVERRDFEEISRNYELVPENYILFYNLDSSILPLVGELERALRLPILIYRKPIIREWGLYSKWVRGKASFYHVGPREFINLLKRAELIFTDSFHGLTLSILFEKPVNVAIYDRSPRARIKTRIEDLIKLLGLEKIVVRNENDVRNALRSEVNYSDVKSKLSELRKKSLGLLKEALSTTMG